MSPADVAYETIEAAPGRYFRCSRYGLMSVDSCSRNFAAAPRLTDEGRLAGCIGCPVGILHSGGSTAVVSAPVLARICTRCRRDPADTSKYRSTRQGRIRMVREGMLCVSCFNREREVMLGRNARNTRPRDLVLRELTVAYIVEDRVSVTRLAAAKDAVEGALNVMRRSGGKALVTWVGSGVVKQPKSGRCNELESHRSRVQLVLWEAA